MAHQSDRPQGNAQGNEVIGGRGINSPHGDLLGFSRESIEVVLPKEIGELIASLEKNIKILKTKIQELQNRLTPGDSNTQSEIAKRELKIEDFTRMIRQLLQFSNDPEVIQAARTMNEIYSRRTESENESEYEFLSPLKRLFEKKNPVKAEEYVSAEEKLDDALDAAQTRRIAELASTGDRSALLETYIVALDRYTELTDKILKLPKDERDRNIDILITTLNLYESLTNAEYQQEVGERMTGKAQEIFENQNASFIEKSIDVAVDIFGGDEGIFRIVSVAAGKVGKSLMRPVTFDKELIDAIEEEVKKQIVEIGSVVDMSAIDGMRRSCLELKANPDNVLVSRDQQEFMKVFREFVPTTTAVMKKVIDTQIDLIQYGFPLSRGEKTSEFPANSVGRAKFMQIKGRDIYRLMQLYSPFGILLPENVEKKGRQEPVQIRSAYDMGWFKEHPLLSTGLQGVELAALLRLVPPLAKLSLKAGYHLTPIPGKSLARAGLKKVGNIISKRIGTGVMSGPLSIAIALYTGVEVVDELQEIHITATEEEIIKIIEKYTSLRSITPEDGEKIRILTLRNELEKKRGVFQEIGVNLGENGMGVLDRLSLGNLVAGLSLREDIKKTGKLREAFLEANRKLVILNLQPFVMQ